MVHCTHFYWFYIDLWGGSVNSQLCMKWVTTHTTMELIQVYEVGYYTHSYGTYTGLWGGSLHSQQWYIYKFMSQGSTLTTMEPIKDYEAGDCTHSYGTYTGLWVG